MDAFGTVIHIVAMVSINRVRLIKMNAVLNMGEFQLRNLLFYSKKKTLSSLLKSERQDLNLRPPQPHCGALPGCATLRKII